MTFNIKPRKFSGLEHENALIWIHKFENCCMWYKWNDEERSIVVGDCLEDSAANWYMCLKDNVKSQYDHFKKAFIRRYVYPNQLTILSRIESVTQTSEESVHMYTKKFEDLAAKIDRTMYLDVDLIRHYIKGLQMKLRVLVATVEPKCFNDAVSSALHCEHLCNVPKNNEFQDNCEHLRKETRNYEFENTSPISYELESSISSMKNHFTARQNYVRDFTNKSPVTSKNAFNYEEQDMDFFHRSVAKTQQDLLEFTKAFFTELRHSEEKQNAIDLKLLTAHC